MESISSGKELKEFSEKMIEAGREKPSAGVEKVGEKEEGALILVRCYFLILIFGCYFKFEFCSLKFMTEDDFFSPKWQLT